MQLSIRARLVISFVAVALLVLLVFGFTAYRIALDADLNKEAGMLRYSVAHKAEHFLEEPTREQATEELKALLTSHSDPGHLLVLIDADGHHISSQPVEQFFGASYDRFSFQDLLKESSTSGVKSTGSEEFLWARSASSNSNYKLITVSRRKNDTSSFPRTIGVRLLITGAIIIWFAVWGALILAAVTNRRLEEQNTILNHHALHDDLTDLPNRNLLYRRLSKVLGVAEKTNQSVALVVMDLDRFRETNDALGHHCGDLLLQQVGARIVQMLRDTDTVARLGGDEFALLLPGVDRKHALQFAHRMGKVLDQPFILEDMRLNVEASLGVAVYPDHGQDAETLVRQANIAMYQAKKATNGISIYDSEHDPDSRRRLVIMGKLRHAIDHDEGLELHFQPKVNLKTGGTNSVEALLRWVDPELGSIPPGEFVTLAEQSGLIKPLTLWVLNTALRQCNTWRHNGVFLNIAVNLSTRNLQDEKLGKQVCQLLDAWDIPPTCLILEITESAVMADPLRAQKVLSGLDEVGVRISVDDFGTGYSSMSLLSQLPVYEIKIDRSFVINMLTNKKNEMIVRSVVELAHNLEYVATAEGVEDQETLDYLMELGCDRAQGYFMSRPVPSDELVKWLAESQWGRCPAPNVVLMDGHA